MTITTTNELTSNFVSMIVMILFWPIFLWIPVFFTVQTVVVSAYSAVVKAILYIWNGAGQVFLVFARLCAN